ncbi:thioesterase family protein [Nocardia beijingensis]|uniref:thioesterase family protein n=1 Tax=Nocardia beijingensis TaxID=95162 RepID=UPI00189593ED|nr:thioesterase family protein [Nocardia beijingensis]MBF6079525.1 thioesterase family protein [Nocardia beijingensis]
MTIELPTAAQIRDLPAAVTATVTAAETDGNGHMNVLHYLNRNSEAADILVRGVGVDESYRGERRLGLFTAEHHLAYHSELREGESFSVHARVLDRSDKAVHMMTFVLDRQRDRLANTLEILLVHVDLERRRASPLPVDVGAALDAQLEVHRRLRWAAPVCGAMRIRR